MKLEVNVLKPLGYGLINHKREIFMRENVQIVYLYKHITGIQMTTSGRKKSEPIVCIMSACQPEAQMINLFLYMFQCVMTHFVMMDLMSFVKNIFYVMFFILEYFVLPFLYEKK